MLIANSILPLIFHDFNGFYRPSGSCGFSLSTSPLKEIFIVPELYQYSTGVNIRWLDRFIQRIPEPFFYKYYLENAQKKNVNCGLP